MLGDGIDFVESAAPIPWSAAWAKAIEATTGKIIVMMSDDVELRDGWLAPILIHLAEDQSCGAVSPAIEVNGALRGTQAPDTARSVCLVVRKRALESDSIGQVSLIGESRVKAVELAEATAVESLVPSSAVDAPVEGTADGLTAVEGSSEPFVGAPTIAPGGGAPVGPDRLIGDGSAVDPATKDKRLHLGCGTNKIVGWTNVDGDPACNPDLAFDLSQPMPFADRSIERIYSEHLFEHLPLPDGVRLMAECHRVLSDNGVMRIAMPDLQDCVLSYLRKWQDAEWVTWYPNVDSAAMALNMCFREWGHQYLYDLEDLTLRLRSVGFTRITTPGWGISTHPELCNLETRSESILIVEVQR